MQALRQTIAATALAIGAWSMPLQGHAEEKAGYYYPDIGSEEVFARDISPTAPEAGRAVRVQFVTQVTQGQLSAPAEPRFSVFAKGSQAQHMIIVALDDEVFKTLYRARAKLTQLTAAARGTDFFSKNGISSFATWLDLARLLGFRDVVLSDGETWSHRIILGQPEE